MLDVRQIRADPEGTKRALARRGEEAVRDVDEFLAVDAGRRELLARVETARADRNAAAKAIAEAKQRGEDAAAEIARQAELKEQQAADEAALAEAEAAVGEVMLRIPNIPHPSSPAGAAEEDAEIVRMYGKPPEFGFEPRDHLDLAGPDGLGLIDPESAARVSGSRFHYLKGDLVRLEFALIQWGLTKLATKGFVPVIPPVLVKREAMVGTGFFPEAEAQVYALGSDDLFLVGTAEVPLASMHGGETLAEADLPLHYVGFSTCFRREAGAAGKDTRGIFRVHQFDKLELFSYCHPDTSWDEHERLLAIEEEIAQELGFHYQVVDIPAGDLGASAARKYDIEVWLPGQARYRELTSCSNCTDYQARRLNTRFRPADGKPQFVHMLNGTAITSSRTLLALIEYGQREDGSIAVPEVLHPFGAPGRAAGARRLGRRRPQSLSSIDRRGGGAAERTGLENRRRGATSSVGSNPTPAARRPANPMDEPTEHTDHRPTVARPGARVASMSRHQVAAMHGPARPVDGRSLIGEPRLEPAAAICRPCLLCKLTRSCRNQGALPVSLADFGSRSGDETASVCGAV